MSDSGPKPLRILYMGTPEFAVPALKALANSRDTVVGVVTRPDRPRGRGKKMRPTAVKKAAQKLSIPVFQPENINDEESLERLRELDPDVAVVAAFGQILKAKTLDVPRHGSINIHASLLPRYRGAAPINWAIVRGEEFSGVTIMAMDEGLDTGPMLLKKKTAIAPLETAGELHDRLSHMGAELIVDVMRLIHLDSLTPIPQDDDKSTYAPMLKKSDGLIDWSQSARAIADRVRGFHPWPGTFSFLRDPTEASDDDADNSVDGERIKFHLARPLAEISSDLADAANEVAPGTVLRADRSAGTLLITTGKGILECLRLQAAGRQAMDVDDFLNGHTIDVGHRFGGRQ